MTTIQTAAEATEDNRRIMARLAELGPIAAAASAATVRLSKVAEDALASMSDTALDATKAAINATQSDNALDATTAAINEYGIAAAAGNEANEIVDHVADVISIYDKAAMSYNAAAFVANTAIAAANEKMSIARDINAAYERDGLFRRCWAICNLEYETVKERPDIKKLHALNEMVESARVLEVMANPAIATARKMEANVALWTKIVKCYDLDSIRKLANAIRQDARTALSTPAIARFEAFTLKNAGESR